MGIYEKRRSVPRGELGKTLRASRRIPGTGGKKYTQREVEKLEREVFRPKYGSQISKEDYRRALRGLESTRRGVRTRSEKSELDKKIRYLKGIGGV